MDNRGVAPRSNVLANAGRSALRAFVGSLIIVMPGVLAAPNLDAAYGLGVAALIASATAAIRVLQDFVPFLTTGSFLPPFWSAIADSALRAFVGSALILLPGVLNAPDLASAKGLVTSLLVAAVTAAFRALEGVVPLESRTN